MSGNHLWEQVGWIGLDAATCAIGDGSSIAADHRLDPVVAGSDAKVTDLTPAGFPLIILRTGADLELPVEVARGSSGVVEAVRMELVEDVADIEGTWTAVATLDLSNGSLFAADPFCVGPQYRLDLVVKPGRWRVEAFEPADEELAGPLGLRALWTTVVPPSGPAPTLDDLVDEHQVRVESDHGFQRRARLLQSLWRTDHGLDAGTSPDTGDVLGSWLTDDDAAAGRNFLTPYIGTIAAAAAAQAAVTTNVRNRQLIDRARLLGNLLSSQPLCFNLFGELAADLHLASRVFHGLWPDAVAEVAGITFEESPGRKDPLYLDNKSAADVLVRHTTPAGGMGFIAIDVKYHEDLVGTASKHRRRYDKVAAESGAFQGGGPDLRRPPLQQLWLDHLLALSMLRAGDGWECGRFVLVHPERNQACATAAEQYQQALSPVGRETAGVVTLEALHDAINAETDEAWVSAFRARYLDFDRIDRLLDQ